MVRGALCALCAICALCALCVRRSAGRDASLTPALSNCTVLMSRAHTAAWMVVAAAAAATACSKPVPPPKAAPEVSVITVEPRTVDDKFEFLGDVEPSRSAAVRSQLSGTIVSRTFHEGQVVRPGD